MTDELPADFLSQYREAMGDDTVGNAQVFLCLINSREHTTFFTGSSMNFTLTSLPGEQTMDICGTFEDNYPLDGVFILDDDPAYLFCMTAPLSVKPQLDAIGSVDGCVDMGATLWRSTPSQTLSAVQAILTDAGVIQNYMLFNLSQAFELFRNTTFAIDLFTYIFIAMLSLIAVANVFNTISTNIRLRRRELAMLRSVGMSARSFDRMMRFECAFYGIWTLIYGLPAAVLLSWMIHKVLTWAENIDDIGYVLPWTAIGISVSGVFVVVLITMMYAASKIKKENIIDALRDDNA